MFEDLPNPKHITTCKWRLCFAAVMSYNAAFIKQHRRATEEAWKAYIAAPVTSDRTQLYQAYLDHSTALYRQRMWHRMIHEEYERRYERKSKPRKRAPKQAVAG